MLGVVLHRYIPVHKNYSNYRGIAERVIKNRLQKQGFHVWRPQYLAGYKTKHMYPNQQKAYEKLAKKLNPYADYIGYLAHVHHGLPDYVIARNNEIIFVECKLAHEQLKQNQKKCMLKLQWIGMQVEVHKLVFESTKLRAAYVNIFNHEKKMVEKQTRLKLNW